MNNLSLIRYEMKEINNIVNFLDNENNELDAETINDTKESVVCLLEVLVPFDIGVVYIPSK